MLAQKFTLSTGETMYITLVTDVDNCDELKKKVQCQELLCGFIEPCLIVDPLQILVAADKAVLCRSRGKLVTKNVYSETLFNLSPSKHISKGLSKFGSQGSNKALLTIVIGNEEDIKVVLSQINGKEIDLQKITEFCDIKLIEKEYNIKSSELEISSLLNSVVTRIAAKSLL